MLPETSPPFSTPPPTDPAPASSIFSTLGQDALAGMVVFLVALPLCLGISLASGAPLLAGIITGIVGGVVVSWLSGSHLSVSGPAASITVIILSAIASLGSFQAVMAATIVAGVVQMLLGAAQAGIIGLYFPSGVIRGMLAAIGLILIMKQIPHFMGADSDYFEDSTFYQADGQNTFSAIVSALRHLSPSATLEGSVSLLLMLVWDRPWRQRFGPLRRIPAALVVVVVAIGLNQLLGHFSPALAVRPEHLVHLPVVSSPSELVGELMFPNFRDFLNPDVYLVGLTIAVVASLATLLSVEAVDKLDPQHRQTPLNRELLAQGVGNIVSGLLGGLPMTAVIVRSSANLDAGAQTRLSAFIHGVLLLVSLLFLAQVLNLIPLSAMAAVLLIVGYKLTRPALYLRQWRLGWMHFLPFIVTILAILFLDLLKGVGLGLVVGIFFILKANAKQGYFLHHHLPAHAPGTVYLRLAEHVSFLNKAGIISELHNLSAGAHVVLDGTQTVEIDHDVLEAIEEFRLLAPSRRITLELLGIEQVALK
ncbi:SulP family inorganic anion transporter [Hymenobacter artigasi]|uniref:MFS superfamily sulfate permease-like transporter n=1 Tax=Hymenobacter artigasi TaxID=2719616 RepID=A0ABX1HIT2_9BACT|nr:SulP family inorganic anion transporter [Hymenobacter artigasi]NKI89755.1 MFS superfamily sulfate permease-like transporter [Hymenobacter artigasi]